MDCEELAVCVRFPPIQLQICDIIFEIPELGAILGVPPIVFVKLSIFNLDSC